MGAAHKAGWCVHCSLGLTLLAAVCRVVCYYGKDRAWVRSTLQDWQRRAKKAATDKAAMNKEVRTCMGV